MVFKVQIHFSWLVGDMTLDEDMSSADAEQDEEEEEGEEEEEVEEEVVEEVFDNQPLLVWQGNAAGANLPRGRIFIGSCDAEANVPALKAANIAKVLMAARELTPSSDGFEYCTVGLVDKPEENLLQHFDECFDFVDAAVTRGEGVLVHCYAGRSRSAAIVIAWLMRRGGISLQAAWAQVSAVRPWIAPNEGFVRQLQHFEAVGCDVQKAVDSWDPAAAV